MAGDGLNSRGGRLCEVYEAEQVYDLSFIGAAVEAGEIVYRGSKKIGIVARDLKSRKKEFLNRYTRRMWNSRVRYVVTSKGRRAVK